MPTPLTVEFIGSRVDAIENVTNVTATKIVGGGQAPTASVASLFKQGTAAAATDYPTASRFVTLAYDIVVVNTGYVYFRQNDNLLTSTPNTIKINQVFDRNYENPS